MIVPLFLFYNRIMENQKLYDLLYVTRNTTALRIMDDIACKLRKITLNDLTSIIATVSPDVTTLHDYSD